MRQVCPVMYAGSVSSPSKPSESQMTRSFEPRLGDQPGAELGTDLVLFFSIIGSAAYYSRAMYP